MNIEEFKHTEVVQEEDDPERSQAMAQPNSNVLLFPSISAKPTINALSPSHEVNELLDVYDQLIALLRETDSEGLDLLADHMVLAVVRCREALALGSDDASALQMLKELRAGLREIPRTLRSLLPGLGPRLGESLEHKLGIQFTQY